MLVDALKAETYRLSLNRLQVFLGVLATPLLFAGGGVLFHLITKANGDKVAEKLNTPLPPTTPVNLGEVFGLAADASANGIILICVLIAAATLYAGDYRWETWRLISARNDRVSLILAKVGVVKILAILSSVFFLIAGTIFLTAEAVIYARGVSFAVTGSELWEALLVWLLSYVRIIQFTMMALIAAVMTRSLLAALFIPWALGFAQSLLGTAMPLLGWEPQMWAPQLLLPGLAYDTLKDAVAPGPLPAPLTDAVIWKSALGLTLWTLLPLAGALAWFKRQDLSKE